MLNIHTLSHSKINNEMPNTLLCCFPQLYFILDFFWRFQVLRFYQIKKEGKNYNFFQHVFFLPFSNKELLIKTSLSSYCMNHPVQRIKIQLVFHHSKQGMCQEFESAVAVCSTKESSGPQSSSVFMKFRSRNNLDQLDRLTPFGY